MPLSVEVMEKVFLHDDEERKKRLQITGSSKPSLTKNCKGLYFSRPSRAQHRQKYSACTVAVG